MLRSSWPALIAAVALATVGCAHCKKCSKFPNPGLSEPGCAPSGMPTAAVIGEPMPATETYTVAPPSGPPASAAPSPFTVPASQFNSAPAPAPVATSTPAPAPPAGVRTPARGVTGAGPVGGGSVARPTPTTPPASQPDPLPLSAPPISPPSP